MGAQLDAYGQKKPLKRSEQKNSFWVGIREVVNFTKFIVDWLRSFGKDRTHISPFCAGVCGRSCITHAVVTEHERDYKSDL